MNRNQSVLRRRLKQQYALLIFKPPALNADSHLETITCDGQWGLIGIKHSQSTGNEEGILKSP
jgi:hypothetical protein